MLIKTINLVAERIIGKIEEEKRLELFNKYPPILLHRSPKP